VNRALPPLHGGSLEITLTVPLNLLVKIEEIKTFLGRHPSWFERRVVQHRSYHWKNIS